MADDAGTPRRSCAGNRLAHGVVGGDPNSAPRCGAKTRPARGGRPCLGPAMKNGLCRMHGGASAGPATEAVKTRAAAASLRHGAYSGESIALRAALKLCRVEAEDFVAQLRRTEADAVAEDANSGGSTPNV